MWLIVTLASSSVADNNESQEEKNVDSLDVLKEKKERNL